MAERTVTRAHLTDAVYREIGLSQSESARLVEALLDEVTGRLERGETVKISSFGSFSVRDKAARTGRNLTTGQQVAIAARRVLIFRPSQVLKKRMNAATNPAANPAIDPTVDPEQGAP